MADGFWRGQDPIGRRFSTTHDPSHSVEIIGVVKNSRGASSGLDDLTEIHPFFYVPLAQHIHPIATLQARTAAAPEEIGRASCREIVWIRRRAAALNKEDDR